MALEEHKSILRAIESGDADEAERLTVMHVKLALENFKKTVN
jgi:DNA-binding GntR family transcriptional regulator